MLSYPQVKIDTLFMGCEFFNLGLPLSQCFILTPDPGLLEHIVLSENV